MSTANGIGLIEHLTTHGRNLSWYELARLYKFKDGEAARTVWRAYNLKAKRGVIIAPPARLLNEPARVEKEGYILDLEDKITKYEEDVAKGTAQIEASVKDEIKTLDDLVDKCKIDLSKWQITRWVQNYWAGKYQVKVFLNPIEDKSLFQHNFVEFLKGYTPTIPSTPSIELDPKVLDETFRGQRLSEFNIPKGLLVINKQDLHFDKYDINGDNHMPKRFRSYAEAIERVLHKALLSYNVNQILYIIGSDEFNSEWTGMTTKGTPQKNIPTYQSGFAAICDHEVEMISKLSNSGRKVHVMYMPGNHDEYVGWHMITWLNAYFRNNSNITWDVSPSYRKYHSYGNSALMFAHGDVIKPQKLASIFPQEFKDGWSSTEYQYIFTGDKHHEMSLDIDGILFYQLTQGSNAKSIWDDKNGFINKGFLTAFIISEKWGLGDILKERL